MVRLIPRDEKFFDLFADIATRMTSSAHLLRQLFAEPARLEELVARIKDIEHEADGLTQSVVERIDRSFVTPIDREDIHLLASRLDDVIDLIDGTARRVAMFRIDERREPAERLAEILGRAAQSVEAAVLAMRKPKAVAERAREIKLLEEEGDAVYAEAIGALFDGSHDAITVLKWKEIYDTLEHALDECDDVANVLGSISLKNA